MKKRGNLYSLFSLLAHWCSCFSESHLQSTGETSVFRSCKIKYERLYSSTSGRFYKHFLLQRPSFALLLGPELLMTFKGYFSERSKPLSSSWTNDLRYVLMSPSQKCQFLLLLPQWLYPVVYQHLQLQVLSPEYPVASWFQFQLLYHLSWDVLPG